MQLSPAIYEHAARFTGRRPWDVSRSRELLVAAHAGAYDRYRHAPVVVGIDIYNPEAEAYGAAVREPDGKGIPAIVDHPCTSAAEILKLPAFDPVRDGRLPMILAAARDLRERLPGADVRVPVAGPFSVASNLVHPDVLLCETILLPDAVREALARLAGGQVAFCRHIAAAGLDIAFFESAAAPPLLSPELFRELEMPALRQALAGATEAVGHPVPCIIGGNTLPILPEILSTGTSYVICPAPGETDRAGFLRVMREHPDVTVRVNLDPGVLARGDRAAVCEEIDRIAVLAAGRPNTCIGTGALPYETDPEVVAFAAAYARDRG